MECNCKDNDRAVIPWVRGNRLPLVICVYEDVVTQEGEGSLVHNKMERVPYEIQAADTVTVVMKSGFRQVEMPFTTEGNKVLVTDNGELAAGTYTVEVTIVRGDGARGRWQETRQVRVYENTSDAQLGEMYAIEADLFFYAKGDTGNGIADITANADDTLTITMTDGTTYTTQAMRGEKGDKGDTGERGVSIVSFDVTGQTDVSVIYTVTYSDGTTQEVAVPKGPQGDTGLTGNGIASTTLNNDYTLTVNYTDGTSYTTPSIRGAQGVQGVSVIGFTQTGETETNTVYNLVFSDGRTQSVAIPKGAKGDKGDTGNTGPQGSQGPKGDTVTATDYTLYNVQGSSSEGAMSQDATTKAISAQTGYYVCETVAGTAAKVVTVESGNLYKRTLGGHFKVKMTNKNTAASGVTLKIGSETAPLYYNGETVSASNSWEEGEVLSVFYDGTYYQASNAQGGGGKAEKIKYDSSQSGLAADNVQGALDELFEGNENKDKVLAYALNFLNNKFVGKQYVGIVSPQSLIENPKESTFYLGASGTYSNFGTEFTVDNGNLLVLSYENGSWSHETITIVQSSGYEYTQEKEKTIAAALVKLKLNGGGGGGGDTPSSGDMKTITMKNSDTIAVIGDSYSSEDWGKPQKNWISRLSEFSDYGFMTFAVSGKTFQYMYRSVRGGGLRGKWNVVMPRYAIMCMYTNDIKVLTADQFIRSMDNICRIAEGRGCEPIIVTEHSEGKTFAQRNLYRTLVGDYAKEHNLMFWDIASIAELFSWKFWWGDGHPHALQMPIYSDNYERYMNVMERPKQSIKLFNLRSEVTVGQTTPPYDSIMFTDNYQRAKFFHELNVEGNYCQTLAEGGNVTIGSIALLSAVLPMYGRYCTYLALEFASSVPPQVYVKNSVIEPWLASGTEYIKFSFDSYTSQPQVGDVYKVTGDDSHQYTVVQFNEEDEGKHTIICSPNNNDILGEYTGTLQKVSGSGDSTISFSLVQSVTLDVSSLVENETCGHWQQLTNIGTTLYKYELNATQIGQCIDIDKVHFLIVSESSNVINNPTIYCKGEGDKKYIRGNMDVESNEFSQNEEILPSSTFAAIGQTDTNWTDENGDGIIPTAMSGIENVSESLRPWAYPKGTNSVYTITDLHTLNTTIPSNKIHSDYADCEVWCRYVLPESSITTDSYDYNEIYIKIGSGNPSASTGMVEKRVSTFWTVVRFRMRFIEDRDNGGAGIPLSLFSNSKGIEVAKVSIKYEH